MRLSQEKKDEAMTALFLECGTFFAFNNDQFREGIEKAKANGKLTKKVVNMGAGMYCPKEHVDTLCDGLDNLTKYWIKNDLEHNSKDEIIRRELENHEAYYSGDLESTVRALKGYKFTVEEIAEVYATGKVTTNAK